MTIAKVASICLIIAAVLILLIYGQSFLIPFVIAVLIWYIINALSHWISSFELAQKYLLNWISLALSTLIIALVLIFVGGLIAENAREMANESNKYQQNVGFLIQRIGGAFNFDTSEIQNNLTRLFNSGDAPNFMGNIQELLVQVNLGVIISNVLNTLSGIAGNAFLILIYVLFLLFEQAVFPKKIKALFPKKEGHDQFQEILSSINDAIRAYFKVKLTVSLITAFASYLLMAFIGLDFAIFWAFLIFLLNFIPNIGSLIATIFPALLALVQFVDTLQPFFRYFNWSGSDPIDRRKFYRTPNDGKFSEYFVSSCNSFTFTLGGDLGDYRNDPVRPDHRHHHDHHGPISGHPTDRHFAF